MELSFREIAARLCIASSTACEIFKRFELTGEVQPSSQPRRPSLHKLSEPEERLIIALIMESPTSYLQEICKKSPENHWKICVRVNSLPAVKATWFYKKEG